MNRSNPFLPQDKDGLLLAANRRSRNDIANWLTLDPRVKPEDDNKKRA